MTTEAPEKVVITFTGSLMPDSIAIRLTPERIAQVRDGLFFVVGHHRGGTTLLQAMLASHSRLTLPPETGYFQQVWTRRQQFEPFTDPHCWACLWEYLSSPACAVSDLQLDWSAVAGRIQPLVGSVITNCADLLPALLAEYAQMRDKPRVGEKSPGHIHEIPLLARLYPQARFIVVLRDPRAVVRSEWETPWGSRSAGRIVARWRRVVRRHLQLQADPTLAGRYLAIRYEDLVRNPETQLRAVCQLLGEEFEPGMLQFDNRPVGEQGFTERETWKENTRRPLDPGKAEAWRQSLTGPQIALIESLAGEELQSLGYEPVTSSSGSGLARSWRKFTDRLRWGAEIIAALLRPRHRRRPLSVAVREWWSGDKP